MARRNNNIDNADEAVEVVEEATVEEVVTETEAATETAPKAKTVKAAAPKMVQIKLPLTKSEKDDVYVAVNGKSYQIKRGVYVEVPASVAEVLQHKEEMLVLAMEFEAQAAANVEQ